MSKLREIFSKQNWRLLLSFNLQINLVKGNLESGVLLFFLVRKKKKFTFKKYETKI